VVDAVRHLAGFRQIGHLGTLDPLATGVLCCCSAGPRGWCNFMPGAANDTKRASVWFRDRHVRFRWRSAKPGCRAALDATTIEKFAAERIGRFEQMPPSFSAKKVKGRPAYELARKKQAVELKPVEVEIYEYKLKEVDGSIARFVIECSSGTYIRSLAHEMGQKLGCGAHLAEITRTAVGEFSLEQAITLEELAEAKQAGKFADCLIPLESLLTNFPRVNVLPVIEKRVRHGTKFNIMIAQLQPGRVEAPPGATTQLDGGVNRSRRGCGYSASRTNSSPSPKPSYRARTSRSWCSKLCRSSSTP